MHYVALLTLDAATTAGLERVERAIATVDPGHRSMGSEARLHVTLGAWREIDPIRSAAVLDAFAAEAVDLPLHFASLGMFPGDAPTVFVAPVVTDTLLARHARLHREVAGISSGPVPAYMPGSWVPHCTVAERVPGSVLPLVLAAATALPLPISGRFDEVQLAAFPAARILHAVALGGSGS